MSYWSHSPAIPTRTWCAIHLRDCPECQSRLERLRSEVAEIRLNGRSAPASNPGSPAPDRGPSPSADPLDAPGSSQATTTRPLLSSTEPWRDGQPAPDALGTPGDSSDSETPIPASIGKYLVVGRFPKSGQAEVFRVVHPELRRDLALKLAREPVGEDGRSDVVADGRRLSELEHPNIVRVHDLDFHDGRPFLVMEYIRGRTLAQYVREEPAAPRHAAALLAVIAGAVAFAHRRGIVHQDIKPGNVLVDDSGQPRLIDFGLAWQQDAWSDSPGHSEGGTFAFMAPEQARVELDRVRPLSDVFSLGALLYFLLTGKGPFEAPTPEEAWARARGCEFDRGALKSAKILRRLEAICLKALASAPQDRFRSAADLEKSLRRFLSAPDRAGRGVRDVARARTVGGVVDESVVQTRAIYADRGRDMPPSTPPAPRRLRRRQAARCGSSISASSIWPRATTTHSNHGESWVSSHSRSDRAMM